MNSERPSNISVLDPLTPAINRVKLILFNPFDLSKWFIIGFCAWLANLGRGGGSGGSGRGGNGRSAPPEFGQALNHAKEYFLMNLVWIIPLAIVVFVLLITIWFILIWLSSRGHFMFLHCVVRNKAEVKIPWAQYREHANSLFLFRIILGLTGFIIILVPIIFIVVLIGPSIANGTPMLGAILAAILFGFGIIIISICLVVISKFTIDFVVPIMFLQTASVRAAWGLFMSLLSVNKARFFLYILFQIVIGITIGIIILAIVLMTCCCACCLFILPYIGTVALLPVYIFKRSYSIYYLKQYGPQFDVFGNEIENPQPRLSENPV